MCSSDLEPRTPQACATCFHAHRIRTPSAITLLRRCRRSSPSSVLSDCVVRPSRTYPTATMLHLVPSSPATLALHYPAPCICMIPTTHSRLLGTLYVHRPFLSPCSRVSNPLSKPTQNKPPCKNLIYDESLLRTIFLLVNVCM